jgi:hypothetical protein
MNDDADVGLVAPVRRIGNVVEAGPDIEPALMEPRDVPRSLLLTVTARRH